MTNYCVCVQSFKVDFYGTLYDYFKFQVQVENEKEQTVSIVKMLAGRGHMKMEDKSHL